MQTSRARLEPHSWMPLRRIGSVSISISVAKRLTPLKTAHVIDPAHSSNMTPENLLLTEKAEDRSECQSKLTGPELGSDNLVGRGKQEPEEASKTCLLHDCFP